MHIYYKNVFWTCILIIIYEIIIKLDYKSLNDQGLLTVDENFDSDSNWSMHLYNIQLTSN